MSRDDDAVWEKFIYRAMMMALRLQKWEFLILRTIHALSIPSSPRTASRVFAKIVADGHKAMTIGNEPVMVIAWYMLKELVRVTLRSTSLITMRCLRAMSLRS